MSMEKNNKKTTILIDKTIRKKLRKIEILLESETYKELFEEKIFPVLKEKYPELKGVI